MVVLSDDILGIPAASIEKTRVETTVFDGKVIYKRGKQVQ
jgi:predicted amidohydrolase YtcJ